MKLIIRSLPNRFARLHWCCVSGLTCIFLSSCVTSIDLTEMVRGAAERRQGPRPEYQWNAMGTWRKISQNPATYIPRDYPISAPRGKSNGTWMVDARDGKRLFVPHEKAGDYDSAVLMGDAKKITNWQPRNLIDTRPGIMVVP